MTKFSWRFTNRNAASQARKLGRECEQDAQDETSHRKTDLLNEAARHFQRAKDYDKMGAMQ